MKAKCIGGILIGSYKYSLVSFALCIVLLIRRDNNILCVLLSLKNIQIVFRF